MRSLMSDGLPPPSIIVVESLSITMRLAEPSVESSRFSRLMPRSWLTKVPPVSTARSWRMALRRSPKPGAFTAQTLRTPRRRFTTSAASDSPSTSSAMIRRGLPVDATFSSSGTISRRFETFFSLMRISVSSSTHVIVPGSVMKYGLR